MHIKSKFMRILSIARLLKMALWLPFLSRGRNLSKVW